ncbi:MAG: hypothetical protein WDN06_01950 [Asticcacaulis sp.]
MAHHDDAAKRRKVWRWRYGSLLAGGVQAFPSRDPSDPPPCDMDAWLRARLTGKAPLQPERR